MKIKEGEEYYIWCKNPAIEGKLSLQIATLFKCENKNCDNYATVNGV